VVGVIWRAIWGGLSRARVVVPALLTLGALATFLTPLASATGPTALGCSATAVQAALTAGGDYLFNCSAEIVFPATLTSSQTTTLDATGHTVSFYQQETLGDPSTFRRMLSVSGGSLTMTNIEFVGGQVWPAAGAGGTPGTSGTQGVTGTTVSGDGITAGTGGNGTNGSAGGTGGTAPAGQGAGIFISGGATVTMNGGEIESARIESNAGGGGGTGGGGGRGGFGGQCNSGVCTGGDGGNAGSAAGGGVGGTGGAAQGGAVYVSAGGTFNVNAGTVFDSDTAYGGAGGGGGNGGGGGQGGQGGEGTDGTNGGTGAAGHSAAGGVGGQGGVAQGGAIYNAGSLNITNAVFSNDLVDGGNGGTGGSGGAGSDNAVGTGGTDGSAGANGGAAAVGSAGGAIYNAGTMTLVQATFTTDKAFGGPGGNGGQGGAGGGQVSGFGANGAGGNGTTGGDASFASVYSPTAIVGCATFTGDTLTAGGGGLAGGGGYNNNNNSSGGSGPAGSAGATGSTGVLDPVITGGATCPALSVADSSVPEPSGGGTATLTFTVTLSAVQSKTITVDYATSDGSAAAGTDYDATSGTLTFPAGTTTQTVPVTVHDVGYEADKTLNLALTNPTNATTSKAQAVGTINGRSPLVTTVTVAPSSIVKETSTGPVPVTTTATVTLKNVSTTDSITNVTLPSKLTLGWHAGVTGAGASLPVLQTAAPAAADLNVGTLAPGQSSTPAKYTLEVDGDGSLDVQALALGALGGGTIKGLGTTLFTPDSQLLVFSAKVGAEVHSQTNPALIQAGTSFLVNLTLENRSYYRTIVVDPIYPGLDGNAADGAVLPASVGYTGSNPTGAAAEVEASPYIEIKPRDTAHYLVVVRTGASDAADTQTAVSGGTHATVTFDPPEGVVLGANNTSAAYDPNQYAVVTPGSDKIDVGIDDSGMTAAPWALTSPATWLDATWSVSKGLSWGLWRATYGTVRGILWDLPSLIVKGVYNVSTASLDYMDRVVELWSACGKNPSCEDDLVDTVVDKIIDSYAQAPELLTQTAAQLKTQVDNALTSHFAKLEADWDAGDWRDALTEFTAEGTDTAINVALMIGPAVLARSSKAAAAWNTLKTATYAKVDGVLASTVKALEPAKAAFLALSDVVKPGYWFTEDQMASLFGVSNTESSLLSALTKRLGISVVLRSRASEAIKYLEEGLAVMKPYWIKSKNVNELDVAFLGYKGGTGPESELGRVVFRKMPSQATVEARMRAKGLDPADPEWSQVLSRLKTRVKEYNGEYKQMQKWNKAGKVRGKWPWGENGVNPAVQADTYSTVRFRLNTKGGAVIPEIWSGGKWKFITGDIDLIAITKANGSALSDAEHVAYLKQLSTIIGAQHPESATWINDGKFWFKAKENYLTNEGQCCLAQYGPDGKIRAVQFNSKLSDPTSWTKLNYRIFWNGGYQAGPGG
jgi:hypothetical protein